MCQELLIQGRQGMESRARPGGIWKGSGVPITTPPPWHRFQPGTGAQTPRSGNLEPFATPQSKPFPQGWNEMISKEPSSPNHDPRMCHPHPGGCGGQLGPPDNCSGPNPPFSTLRKTSNLQLKQLFSLLPSTFPWLCRYDPQRPALTNHREVARDPPQQRLPPRAGKALRKHSLSILGKALLPCHTLVTGSEASAREGLSRP